VVACAVAVAVLVLLVSLLGSGGGNRAAGAPDSGGSGTPTPTGSDTATESPTMTPLDGSASGTPPPVEQSGSGGGDPATGAGDPAASTTGTSTPAAGTAPAAGTTATTAPPGPCQDRALKLTVRTVAAAYRVGDKPVITLTVQNVSTATCTRDLGAAQQEIVLYAGTTRLWSSNDCYPGGERNVQALSPQELATFSVTWSGLSSRPRCAGTRTRVGPGSYTLIGRLGTLRSPPGSLVLR
jgi:hypothetical protein